MQFFETDTGDLYVYNGSSWQLITPLQNAASYLIASSATQTDGTVSSNVIYTAASITLTPGTWLVQGQLSLINLGTTDSTQIALYNRTTSATVANSYSAMSYTFTTQYTFFATPVTLMSVTSNTLVCPLGIRNGGSSLRVGNSGATGLNNPAGNITAFRVRS
jgi:hypothetical protein